MLKGNSNLETAFSGKISYGRNETNRVENGVMQDETQQLTPKEFPYLLPHKSSLDRYFCLSLDFPPRGEWEIGLIKSEFCLIPRDTTRHRLTLWLSPAWHSSLILCCYPASSNLST